MSDYAPHVLAAKWNSLLGEVFRECQVLWDNRKPARGWLMFGSGERDSAADQMTPERDRELLLKEGRVAMGHFARAFLPAYIPGVHTHYGSVVYSTDPAHNEQLFELAWRVNELRRGANRPPAGTEEVACAIRNDRSDFARIELPPELGVEQGCYFANICIHRTRLPLGYIHSRLVPILIAPEKSPWCSLLPLRFWGETFQRIWKSGPPACPAEPFIESCRGAGIEP